MARPRYETPEDVENGLVALTRICEHLKCEAVRMPHEAHVNYLLHKKGEARVALEVKTRTNRRLAYPTLMFSELKYQQLCEWGARGMVPILVVRWADAIGWVKLPVAHQLSTGGRYDRGDSKDIGEMVLIGIDKFTLLEEKVFDNAQGRCS